MRREIAHCIIPSNILYKIIDFLIAKAKAMFLLAEVINGKKSLYINFFNRKNPVDINKQMLDKSKAT